MKYFYFACLLWLAACTKPVIPATPVTSGNTTITTWKAGANGARYNKAGNKVVYNKPDANGIFHIYTSAIDGSNEQRITVSGWPENRHQWAEEWSPNGQYIFCYVEKTDYAPESGHTRAQADAIPGYGAYTDIWLIKADGSQAWKIHEVPNNYNSGVIHGAISPDGTLFGWTERVQAPNVLDANLTAGAYDFKVASVTYGAAPALANIRTYRPGNLLAGGELESISPDNTNMLVYSTFETKSIYSTPIYKINLNSGTAVRLTTESFAQCPTYTPDGSHIVYMTGKDADIFPFSVQGADWWIMDADGNNKRRLTYLNKKDNPQSVNQYRLAGTLSFITNTSFLGDVLTQPFGLAGYTVKVDF